MIHQATLTFNGGELSDYLVYRNDFGKHAASAARMRNFLPMPFGGIAKRPGMEPLEEVVTCDRNSLAYPFTASDGTQYVLHFTPGVLTIYRKDGSTAATLDFLPAFTWPAFSWERSLRTMQLAPINDVLFLCHPDFFPLRLSSTSDTDWALDFLPFDRAPMLDENLDPLKTFTVASNPVAASWASGELYGPPVKVFTNSEWLCVASHTSSASNKPGEGANWRDYWRRMFYTVGDAVTLLSDDRSEVAWAQNWRSYVVGAIGAEPGSTWTPDVDDLFYCVADHTMDASYAGSGIYGYSDTVISGPGLTVGMTWGIVYPWIVGEGTSGDWDIGQACYHNGKVYETILAHADLQPLGHTSEPGVGATWATYWAEVTDLPVVVSALVLMDAYQFGDRVSKSGRVFTCILDHDPVDATAPGTGGSWETYWEEVSRMMSSFAADERTPGLSFRLAPEREEQDFQVEIKLLSGSDGGFSGPIVVEGGWNVFTYGDWHGTLKVQRSYDKGVTWETIQTFQSSGDNNVAGTGEETIAVMLRLGFVKDGTTAASGTMRAVLLPESQSVTGYVLMDTYVGPDEMTGIVKTPIISGNTYHWSEGAFSSRSGFPQALTLHERRLIFAATADRPVSLWMSKIDDYMNFQTTALDDGGIYITLASGSQSAVRWLASARRLFIGTALGEWVAGSETDDLPMTFGNLQIRQYSTKGSCHHRPLLTQDGVYFLGRNASRLYELAAAPGQGPASFAVEDHSRLAEHLTAPGVSSLSFQQTREPCLWAVTRGGDLLSFHHSREEQQSAWAMHTTTGGEIFDCVVFPSDTGDDEVFFITKRGATVHLERFAQAWQTTQEAGTVGAYTDGVDEEPIVSELRFLPVDLAMQGGTTHGRRKRANEVLLSVFRSYGGGIRYDNDLQNFEYQTGSSLMDTAPPLETGWISVTLSPGYVVDLQPAIIHSAPYPFTVRAAVLRWEIHEP